MPFTAEVRPAPLRLEWFCYPVSTAWNPRPVSVDPKSGQRGLLGPIGGPRFL